jgi:hypothetical protein
VSQHASRVGRDATSRRIRAGVAQTAFNQLYMLKRPGQVDAGIFSISSLSFPKEFVQIPQLDENECCMAAP